LDTTPPNILQGFPAKSTGNGGYVALPTTDWVISPLSDRIIGGKRVLHQKYSGKKGMNFGYNFIFGREQANAAGAASRLFFCHHPDRGEDYG